jgi:hypothetical protein
MLHSLERGVAVSARSADIRRGPGDRRRLPRGGRRVSDKLRLALFVTCSLLASRVASAQTPIGFGFDVNAAARARSLGIPTAYGSIWAGVWNQPEKNGWGGIRTQLLTAKSNRVTPVVIWWYWGDDISPSCVENGCKNRYDLSQHKDKAEWYRMTAELADLIASVMGPNSGAILVVEPEFNQGGIGRYEKFDGYLADQMEAAHKRGVTTALEFGNWDQHLWKNFDRAVAGADLLGVMALQSSVRDASTYLSGADMLLSQAKYYQKTFNKPTFVTDFAFSSYPEPSYEAYQDTVIRDIFRRMDEFRAAGVRGMVWRMLADDPKFNTANYHKMAERHWGLIRADGTPKAAFQPFVDGVVKESRLSTSSDRTRRSEQAN